MNVYTIGHSNRTFKEFVDLLKDSKIGVLADVRSLPGSRHVPQFDKENLEVRLPSEGIEYKYFEDFGGRRKALPREESKNGEWQNDSFRGYADYMQTEAFENALNEFVEIASEKGVAIMCAEAVPWRCHRSLIGDTLLARGYTVYAIISATSVREEVLTSFAKVRGTNITYPKQEKT